MLTFRGIVDRSIRLVLVLLAADFILGYGLIFAGYPFVETFGDFMLLEVAVLFVLAGLMDFSSSLGAVQFRRTILHARQEYSASKHKEVERKAAVFLLGGLIIFLGLVVLAIYLRARPV